MTANAVMLREFLDALNIAQVDLVGNDSGGGIAQIFAATFPERVPMHWNIHGEIDGYGGPASVFLRTRIRPCAV